MQSIHGEVSTEMAVVLMLSERGLDRSNVRPLAGCAD
jgi:hypothetical protein